MSRESSVLVRLFCLKVWKNPVFLGGGQITTSVLFSESVPYWKIIYYFYVRKSYKIISQQRLNCIPIVGILKKF